MGNAKPMSISEELSVRTFLSSWYPSHNGHQYNLRKYRDIEMAVAITPDTGKTIHLLTPHTFSDDLLDLCWLPYSMKTAHWPDGIILRTRIVNTTYYYTTCEGKLIPLAI